MALGIGKVHPIAVSALAGALVNLPISWFLTRRIGVAGVIWGTVLTTLISNGLVPGIYLFRRPGGRRPDLPLPDPQRPGRPGPPRCSSPPGPSARSMPADPTPDPGWTRFLPFFVHLAVGGIAYLGGYIGDLDREEGSLA